MNKRGLVIAAIIIIILILNGCSASKILENDETTEVYQVSSVADIEIEKKILCIIGFREVILLMSFGE